MLEIVQIVLIAVFVIAWWLIGNIWAAVGITVALVVGFFGILVILSPKKESTGYDDDRTDGSESF
ncbi:MAG: hypothetical protein ABIA11_03505 [Patescibacteria group bacterium]